MPGSVRVIPLNPRQAPDAAPEPGEVVIRIDRANPVLGNPHVLANKLDARARAEVIALYEKTVDADWAVHGPIRQAVEEMASRVRQGEQLCLACHCHPMPCHGDVLAHRIRGLVYAEDPEMMVEVNRMARRWKP